MVVLTTFPPPEEGVKHRQERTSADVAGKHMGQGTLYIAESRVSWMSEGGQGFSLEYPSISLHAISRDLTAYPKEHLYLMVDAKLGDDESSGSESEEERDPLPSCSEVRFAPDDCASLQAMYQAMSDCQILHPDEDQSNSEEDEGFEAEGDGQWFTGEEGLEHLSEQGIQNLDRIEHVFEQGMEPEPGVGRVENGQGDEGMDMDENDQFEDADVDH